MRETATKRIFEAFLIYITKINAFTSSGLCFEPNYVMAVGLHKSVPGQEVEKFFSKRGHQPVLGHQVNSRDCRDCHWNFGCWEVWALLWKFWSHDLHSTESTGKSLCGMEKKSGDTRNFTKVWGKKWLTVPVDIKALGLLRFFWPEVNFGLWYLFVSFYGLSMKNGEGEGKSERSVGKEEDRGRELGGGGP